MKPNFKILDGLRGIAATYVLINHARGHLLMGGSDYSKIVPISQWSFFDKLYYSLLQFTALGREFVILFFILSGFSIAYSLQRKSKIFGFYKRRLTRLYPPYMLALVWAAVVFLIAKSFYPPITVGEVSVFSSLQGTLCNLFYIPNGGFIPQFWSLTYEVIFYLLVPFLILNRRVYYAASVILYAISIYISWRNVSGTNIISMYLLDYNIYFAAGIWLFHNYEKVALIFVFRNRFVFYAVSFFLFLSMIAIKFKTTEYNKITLMVATLFSVILIVNFLSKEINGGLLNFLGKMSYTLYITHFASVMLFKTILYKTGVLASVNITEWYIWMIGVVFAVLLSLPFYYLAELPSKKLLSRIRATS